MTLQAILLLRGCGYEYDRLISHPCPFTLKSTLIFDWSTHSICFFFYTNGSPRKNGPDSILLIFLLIFVTSDFTIFSKDSSWDALQNGVFFIYLNNVSHFLRYASNEQSKVNNFVNNILVEACFRKSWTLFKQIKIHDFAEHLKTNLLKK